MSVAPYHVIITLVNPDDEVQARIAEELYSALGEAGVEVILDNRNERPGVKFKDADLVGIPVRITVGRGAVDGIVEYKLRRESEKIEMKVKDALNEAIAIVNAEKRG